MMITEIDELSNAIELATRAHYTQKDKQGEPYIFHPLRVMMCFNDEKERIVAVLHDVIEDSDLELSDLDDYGFSDAIIVCVGLLTKLPNEQYFDYLDRVKSNPVSLAVKLADIDDNVKRINKLYDVDRNEAKRLDRKYREAKRYLNKR